MEKTSKEYSDAMQNSIVVPDQKHPMIAWKEGRLRTKKWGEKATTGLSKCTGDEGSSDKRIKDTRVMTMQTLMSVNMRLKATGILMSNVTTMMQQLRAEVMEKLCSRLLMKQKMFNLC